jgi:hypothetical protein
MTNCPIAWQELLRYCENNPKSGCCRQTNGTTPSEGSARRERTLSVDDARLRSTNSEGATLEQLMQRPLDLLAIEPQLATRRLGGEHETLADIDREFIDWFWNKDMADLLARDPHGVRRLAAFYAAVGLPLVQIALLDAAIRNFHDDIPTAIALGDALQLNDFHAGAVAAYSDAALLPLDNMQQAYVAHRLKISSDIQQRFEEAAKEAEEARARRRERERARREARRNSEQ